jgi:hypothetical protein
LVTRNKSELVSYVSLVRLLSTDKPASSAITQELLEGLAGRTPAPGRPDVIYRVYR